MQWWIVPYMSTIVPDDWHGGPGGCRAVGNVRTVQLITAEISNSNAWISISCIFQVDSN